MTESRSVDSRSVVVRRPTVQDVPQLVRLILAHAEYEHASIPANGAGLADRLIETLIEPQTRAACFVAQLSDEPDRLIGYSTCSAEFATWSAAEFLHMDTLYVDEGFRGLSIGKHLLDAVVAHAAMLGLHEVQWQTPDWNTDAVRFYERVGAVASNKIRFKLPIPTADGQKPNTDALR
jgi:ribosomal protein S18 acetylase RimI-like enzyme